MLGPIKHMDCI